MPKVMMITVQSVDVRKPPGEVVDLTWMYDGSTPPAEVAVTRVRRSSPRRPLKVAVTGFTRKQAFPGHRERETKIDVPLEVVEEMRRQGVEVDWAVCPLSEELGDVDAAFVMLGACLTMHGVRYACEALWVVEQARRRGIPVALFYDDWKVDDVQKYLKYAAERSEGPFRKRAVEYAASVSEVDYDLRREAIVSAASTLCGSWPDRWTALCPMYSGWGDRERAFSMIPAQNFLTVDPTPVTIDLDRPRGSPRSARRRWLLASLGDHSRWVRSLGLRWPVEYAGYKKLGDRLASEDAVRDAVDASWGCLSPPYPQAGSGWFRSRYVYAAKARRVMLADPREAEVMGDAYRIAPADVEGMTDAELFRLAKRQEEWLIDGGKVNVRVEQFQEEVTRIVSALRGESVDVRAERPAAEKAVKLVASVTRVMTNRPAVKKAAQPKSTVEANPKLVVKMLGSEVPTEGETSGQFVRRLWMTGRYATSEGVDRLVSLVHANWGKFPRSGGRECRTKRGDVRWNVYKLAADGAEGVPPFPSGG